MVLTLPTEALEEMDRVVATIAAASAEGTTAEERIADALVGVSKSGLFQCEFTAFDMLILFFTMPTGGAFDTYFERTNEGKLLTRFSGFCFVDLETMTAFAFLLWLCTQLQVNMYS